MKLISIFKTPIIEFLCDSRYINVAPHPEPAIKNLPEWFKRIPAYSETTRDQNGRPLMNAKKCLPMIDAMSLGFTIYTPIDQHVRVNKDCTQIELGPTSTLFEKVIEFHSLEQVGGKNTPFGKLEPIKFINPWVVKTAPGWSTLFIAPINSMEDRFMVLGGLVDTDKYIKQVNFPGKWLKGDFDDTLYAGTPLVTAIPIRRDTMSPKYAVRELNKKDIAKLDNIGSNQMAKSHYYTKQLRETK